MRTGRCISDILAGVYVPADIYARYLRLKGEEVFDDWWIG